MTKSIQHHWQSLLAKKIWIRLAGELESAKNLDGLNGLPFDGPETSLLPGDASEFSLP